MGRPARERERLPRDLGRRRTREHGDIQRENKNEPKMKIRGWKGEKEKCSMLNLVRISQQNKKAISDPRASRLPSQKHSDEGDGVDEEPGTEAESLRMTEEEEPERRRHEGR